MYNFIDYMREYAMVKFTGFEMFLFFYTIFGNAFPLIDPNFSYSCSY